MGENKEARIDYEKCIACGACVYQCPFGAITDRSYILDVIDIIQQSEEGKNYKISEEWTLPKPTYKAYWVASSDITIIVKSIIFYYRRIKKW
jgi:ferredoxin